MNWGIPPPCVTSRILRIQLLVSLAFHCKCYMRYQQPMLIPLMKKIISVQEHRSIKIYCKADQLNNCATQTSGQSLIIEPVCSISIALEATSGTSQSSRYKQTAKTVLSMEHLGGQKLLC